MSRVHEIRDPVHGFVRFDDQERAIINSSCFQRLRHIHQLATTFLVYPGATHRRFEHSLGVMELADRVFNTVIKFRHPQLSMLSELEDKDEIAYWRRVLRMAALLHDVGHLPFSHAAEKELLPSGWNHERLTGEIITSAGMSKLLFGLTPPIRSEDVAKIALGPKWPKELSVWESILAEIITGDVLGVDRMDYLLRDSYHAGVAYGRFDHFRLVDTMRILPSPAESHKEDAIETKLSDETDSLSPTDSGEVSVCEPILGIEEGGLHSAEALLLARYFMFTQVYFHPVRRAYDIHLKDFLQAWLPEGKFSNDLKRHQVMTDNEVSTGILGAAQDKDAPSHDHAVRFAGRKHFKVVYERDPVDYQYCPNPGEKIATALKSRFSDQVVRHDAGFSSCGAHDFPVLRRDAAVVSALYLSDILRSIPPAAYDFVFVDPELRDQAREYVRVNKLSILQS